jgi:uncharacterized membrane protein
MVHRRIFAMVVAYDTTMIWLNNLFLLFIAFMPVPSKILVEYPTQVASVVFFAGMHALTTIVQGGLWAYVSSGHRLIHPGVDADLIRQSSLRSLGLVAVLLLSIGVAVFISPEAALLCWVLAAVASSLIARHLRDQKRRSQHSPQASGADSHR